MGAGKSLMQSGLTNHDTEDLGSLAFGKIRLEVLTYCTSDKCTDFTYIREGKKIRSRHAKVFKRVSRDVDLCPDCGHYLLRRTKK